jgi:hypothetical protein
MQAYDLLKGVRVGGGSELLWQGGAFLHWDGLELQLVGDYEVAGFILFYCPTKTVYW